MPYTPSTTKICNLALDELPSATIVSISDTSLQAKACRRAYEQCLAELLENPQWGFAKRRIALAALAVNDRESEWGYAYSLPSAVGFPIRIVVEDQIDDPGTWLLAGQLVAPQMVWPGESIHYEFSGSTFYTGVPDAVLEYIHADPDVATFGALFVKALALQLAARIAMPIKHSRELKDKLLQDAEVATQRALASSLNRNPHRYGDDYIPDVVRARMG